MKAIGLDRPTKGLAGLARTTTANGTIQVTGKEIAAVLSTITTRTTATTEIMTGTTTNTVSTTTTINKRLTVYFWPRQVGGNAIVREVFNSKVNQEVTDTPRVHISDLRRMMRQGKIVAPPILFDATSNSVGRMWSEDDVEAVRAALKTASDPNACGS